MSICYHCDKPATEFTDEKGKLFLPRACRGCEQIFCGNPECRDWICESHPICERCDKTPCIITESTKRSKTATCYHCDGPAYGFTDNKGAVREYSTCRGCGQLFCGNPECSEWICSSFPVCERCDTSANINRSKKRAAEYKEKHGHEYGEKVETCKHCFIDDVLKTNPLGMTAKQQEAYDALFGKAASNMEDLKNKKEKCRGKGAE